MSKRNAALEALSRPSLRAVARPAPAVEAPPKPRPEPKRKTVAASAKRVMLYLPPKAKRKFREIAFHEDRKEHAVYIEALREYLEKRGYRNLLP